MKSSLYRSPPNCPKYGYYSAIVAPLTCAGMNVDDSVTVIVCTKPTSRRFKTILDASVTVTLSIYSVSISDIEKNSQDLRVSEYRIISNTSFYKGVFCFLSHMWAKTDNKIIVSYGKKNEVDQVYHRWHPEELGRYQSVLHVVKFSEDFNIHIIYASCCIYSADLCFASISIQHTISKQNSR